MGGVNGEGFDKGKAITSLRTVWIDYEVLAVTKMTVELKTNMMCC